MFDASSPESAVELVSATSAAETQSFGAAGSGLVSRSFEEVTARVTEAGDLTTSAVGGLDLEIAVDDAQDAELVDGALVQDNGSGATVVARLTDLGVQMVAVLEDAQAANGLDFVIGLPAGGRLEGQPDGSVTVLAPVSVAVPLPGEEEREWGGRCFSQEIREGQEQADDEAD